MTRQSAAIALLCAAMACFAAIAALLHFDLPAYTLMPAAVAVVCVAAAGWLSIKGE